MQLGVDILLLNSNISHMSFEFPRPSSTGVTLLELLIAIAVAALVAGIAVPGFSGLVQSSRMTGAVNSFAAALNLARSEAIRRGVRVTVCPASTGDACAGEDFAGGWAVIAGDAPYAQPQEVVRVYPPPPGAIAMRTSGRYPYVSYTAAGDTRRLDSDAFLALTVRFCDDVNDRRIVISRSGRPSLRHLPCDAS